MLPKRTFSTRTPLQWPVSAFAACLLLVGAGPALADGPSASDVSVSGVLRVGRTLTGSYQYSDPEGDPEGNSRYTWVSYPTFGGRCFAIFAAVIGSNRDYTLTQNELNRCIAFQVTPVAQYDSESGGNDVEGATTRSPIVGPVEESSTPPTITGQRSITIDEDTPRELTVDDFMVNDPDSDPDEISIVAVDGNNYSANGSTITPASNYSGTLTVGVRANDGDSDSGLFNTTVTVRPVNDIPRITGQSPNPVPAEEDASFELSLGNVSVADPDDDFPGDFTFAIQPGDDYTVSGNTVTPAPNFDGRLQVLVSVTDASGAESAAFGIDVEVTGENDAPSIAAAIADTTVVENTPFELDLSDSFEDVDGDDLTYEVAWADTPPPNISFDADSGVFSGTPRIEDTEAPGPVYDVTVTARDPAGEFAVDTFVLTIAALDRANLALSISVSPETGQPGDEFLWTFTSTNPVGPQAGATVEVSGEFTGTSVTAVADAGADCAITSGGARTTNFRCAVGALPVGASATVGLRTTVNAVTEVLVSAITASAGPVPIDPNMDDNAKSSAIGVGDAFSAGAAEAVGSTDVLAMAAGDVNGDGRTDIAVGTGAGQPVSIFLADTVRESCNCYRDFVGTPRTVPSTGESVGVALADFDGNGSLDLVVANANGQPDEVFANDGSGNFSTLATLGASFARAVATGDFNGDGNTDIVVATASGNPVYLGNGAGGFVLESTLGDDDSYDVAVARLDADALDDIVFANNGTSRAWRWQSGSGFTSTASFSIGFARSVAIGDLDSDGRIDIVFGRSFAGGSPPSNPLYFGDGDGRFGGPGEELGLSPTVDVATGDIDRDGATDVVFINQSGVHQVWLQQSGNFVLAPEQIIDIGATAVTIGEFGEVAASDAGGNDIAIGGGDGAGIGIYLNDGSGNLGRGDTVPPALSLVGETSISVPANPTFADPGVLAIDNIDGDISATVVTTSNVNPTIVGTYTVTYNVSDFAGNAAPPVSRTVNVEPAAGTGGGGGGALSPLFVAALLLCLALGIAGVRRGQVVGSRVGF